MKMLLILCSIVTFSGLGYAETEQTAVAASVCANVDDLRAGDWLILDLDATTITEAQILGRDPWFFREIRRTMQVDSIPYGQAKAKLSPLSVAVKSASQEELTESCLPGKIHELQARGVGVFAITGRHPKFAPVTVKVLSDFDIHFDQSAIPARTFQDIDWSGIPNKIQYTHGIFLVDSADKGEILKRIMGAVTVKPKLVKFFDDQQKNVKTVEQAMHDLDLQGVAFHYVPKETEPVELQMRIADVELNDFIQRGKQKPIMSDAAALQILRKRCDLVLGIPQLPAN